jgi:hypothetical protein
LSAGASAPPPVRNQEPGTSLPGPDAGHPLHGAGGHGVPTVVRGCRRRARYVPDRPVSAGNLRSLAGSAIHRLSCVQAGRSHARTDLLSPGYPGRDARSGRKVSNFRISNWSGNRSTPFGRLQSSHRSWRCLPWWLRCPGHGAASRSPSTSQAIASRPLSQALIGRTGQKRVGWHRRRLRQRLRLRHRLRRRQRSTVGPQRQLEVVDVPTLIQTRQNVPYAGHHSRPVSPSRGIEVG